MIASEVAGAITLNGLAEQINEVNREAKTGCYVNRRTLAKIQNTPQKVGLTYPILIALSTYFEKRGQGLQQVPILETRGVLKALWDAPRVVFMIGAKPRPEERRTDMSRWDTRSLAKLLTQACKFNVQREFDIEDVLWRNQVRPKSIESERWHHTLAEDQASVISIGSPLAALSSEVMLARMFGVQPFAAPHFKTGRQVPFFFACLPKVTCKFRSAFGLSWRELQADHPSVASRVKRNEAAAFILDGQAHCVPARGHSWTVYGIIAAQRRTAGNVWLVVSGLTGPATYATAKMVQEISAELPWSKGHPSRVLWVPVKVKIKAGEPNSLIGDVREVVNAEFDGEPRIWPDSKPQS